MTSFSTLSKTYAKDKLSKCATTILLMCCYLYRKRSNVSQAYATSTSSTEGAPTHASKQKHKAT